MPSTLVATLHLQNYGADKKKRCGVRSRDARGAAGGRTVGFPCSTSTTKYRKSDSICGFSRDTYVDSMELDTLEGDPWRMRFTEQDLNGTLQLQASRVKKGGGDMWGKPPRCSAPFVFGGTAQLAAEDREWFLTAVWCGSA